MAIDGFAPDRIDKLAAGLTTAANEARGIRASITRIVTEAEDAAGKGGYSASPPGAEPDGGALQTITRAAPPMSADVKTRLAHLLACQADGLPIDPSLFFNDEKPPDPAKVKAAIAYFNKHIDGSLVNDVDGQEAREILADWRQLTPTELDAVINSLPDDQLKKLNGMLGAGIPGLTAGGADRATRLAFANMIFSEVGAKAIDKTDKDVPVLQPDSSADGVSGLRYQKVPGPLFPKDGVNAENDISQGEDGDCWFLAGLGTITLHDPGFLQQHIHENDNGTYTVTFYSGGKPVKITVDGTLPVNVDPKKGSFAGGLVYAHSNNTTSGGDNTSLYAAIYEKAYAQFKGSYQAIDKGFGDQSLTDLTGNKAIKTSTGDYSLSQINSLMKSGAVMTTGSKDDKNLWDKITGGGPETMDANKVVTSHEYMVKSVNLNSHPPTITLVNPWGSGGTTKDNTVMPQEVTLTQQQWNDYFDEVSIGKP